MVQHKVKVKQTLPKGVKQKVKKEKKQQPKKGHSAGALPSKKSNVVQQNKVSAEVSKIINDKNEEMVRGRADTAVGRTANTKKD